MLFHTDDHTHCAACHAERLMNDPTKRGLLDEVIEAMDERADD